MITRIMIAKELRLMGGSRLSEAAFKYSSIIELIMLFYRTWQWLIIRNKLKSFQTSQINVIIIIYCMDQANDNTNTETPRDFKSKIIILGDHAVGKSSIILQYTDNEFRLGTLPTIGVDYRFKTIKCENNNVKLIIWDTAGQEKYRGIASTYYKGCSAMVFVFDLTSRQSFQNVQRWIDEAKIYVDGSFPRILVGNKSDCLWEVTKKQVEQYAKQIGIQLVFASAKTNEGISEVFEYVTKGIIKAKKSQSNQTKIKPKNEASMRASKITKHSPPKKPRWICPIFEKWFS